jgi:hypothetical protein
MGHIEKFKLQGISDFFSRHLFWQLRKTMLQLGSSIEREREGYQDSCFYMDNGDCVRGLIQASRAAANLASPGFSICSGSRVSLKRLWTFSAEYSKTRRH